MINRSKNRTINECVQNRCLFWNTSPSKLIHCRILATHPGYRNCNKLALALINFKYLSNV